ncbi:MAG: alpha/beta hydrolase [Anaerolineales bacterium]|nr:MAG: alpha/beta hydrolase [Anaerolineales bacterium]
MEFSRESGEFSRRLTRSDLSENTSPVGDFITANGLDIFYREYGQGRPLILLHGATDTHALWKPHIPTLSETFRVFTPDSRGHGRTVNPDPSLSYQVLADDLAAFIQALQLEKPFVFGYSDGGQAVLDFGIRYPDLAGGLVIGGAWYKFSRAYQNAIRAAGFEEPGLVNYRVYEQNAPPDWEDRLRRAHPNRDPDYPKILLNNLASLWWTPLNYSEEDFKKITAPTLILVGEKDEMIPLDEAREMAGLIPGAEFHVIQDATHNAVLQAGGKAVNLVLNFLQGFSAPKVK